MPTPTKGQTRPLSCVSREEFIADITLSNGTNQPYQLPTQGGTIPNDRFMFGMRLQFEGRMTNPASGNPTGFQADAPFSLLENVRVEGYHRIRMQRERFVDARFSDLRELNRDYSANAPFTSLTGAQLVLTASSTNDIRMIADIPFVPQNVPVQQQTAYLCDAPNYDALQLTLQFSDDKSVFTGQTTAPTFSAYGSASGNPRVRVHGLYALAGMQRFQGFLPARVWRYYQEVTSGDIVAGNTNSRLFNLVKGYILRGILAKSGVKSTTVSAGNNVYNTLSNTILANIKIMQGINRPIRFWTDFFALQAEAQNSYALAPTTGYGLIDFAQRGHLWESLNTSALIAGASGDIDLYLQTDITGASNQAALLLYEEIRGKPKRV